MTKDIDAQKVILVVEDDAFIRKCVVEVLEEEGYRADGVENGWEALKYLKTVRTLPALILLDLMMPVMNGWQFRTEQEQDPRFKGIPVILATADGNARQKAAKMNAEGWVKKPIEIDALLKTVQSCGA